MKIDIAEHLLDAVEDLPEDDTLDFYSDGDERLPKHQLPHYPTDPDAKKL